MISTGVEYSSIANLPMTGDARAAVLEAERMAVRAGQSIVTVEHLLLALLDPPTIPLRILLANLRVDIADVVSQLRLRVADYKSNLSVVSYEDELLRVLSHAADESARMGETLIDSRAMLLAVASSPTAPSGSLLHGAGLTGSAIRTALKSRGSAETNSWRDLRRAVKVSPLFLSLVALMLASGLALALVSNGPLIRLLIAIFIIVGWTVQLCIHEFGHAVAGFLGGDREVERRGYLTLDPRKYTHPLLSIVLPLVFLFMGGLPLAGGAVLINHGSLRSRRWQLIVSAAGPFGTLCCLVLLSVPFLLTGDYSAYAHRDNLSAAVAALGIIYATALVLNLLPIPPLDGFHIVSHWLPPEVREAGDRMGFMPMILVFVLLGNSSQFADGFWHAVFTICDKLHLPLELGITALSQIHM